MATADDYAAWIVKNADKQGTPEFETVARAYAAAKQDAPQAASAEPRTAKVDPWRSVGMGLADPVHGGAQLLTKMLPESVVSAGNNLNNWLADKTGLVAKLPEGGVDQQVREREAAYQAERQAATPKTAGGQQAPGVDWWRMAGNVASPVNLALGAAGPVAGAGLATRSAAGAGLGLASGLLNPVTNDGDFATEKAKQAGIGLLGGAAAPVVVAGVGRVVSPAASVNPRLALLRNEGVDTSIGQTLGGRWNAAEEKLMSVPILGDAIARARARSLDQFNGAAINRASGAVGQPIDDIGQAGVARAANAVGGAYDDAATMVPNVRFDQQFVNDLTQLRGMARSLVPDMRRKFEDKLRDVVGGRTSQANAMLPDTFKSVDSEIGGLAAKYGRSTVASEQELGDAFRQLQALLRDQASRTNPAYADALNAANAGYANLVRVEGAAKAAKNNSGVFTPAQLNGAVQSADNSVRKRAVSHGTALMQDLADAGQSVIGNKVPNSFTTDRAMMAGGALGSYLLNPAIPAALLGGAALYSPPAQALLRGLVASRPDAAEAVARLLNQASPALGPAGGLLGYQMMNQ